MFVGPGDPVRSGLVKSLARPGGNTTGVSTNTTEISGKRLQLLLEMTAGVVPKISRVAVLTNPHTPAGSMTYEQVRMAAEKLGVALVRMEVSSPQEIDNAFAAMDPRAAVAAKEIPGGTGPNAVLQQVETLRARATQLAEVGRALPSLSALRHNIESEPLALRVGVHALHNRTGAGWLRGPRPCRRARAGSRRCRCAPRAG